VGVGSGKFSFSPPFPFLLTVQQSDGSFILIKQWIPEHQQDILFEHTRKLREVKQITYTTQEIKKERDQLLLVRKKEPRKRSTSAIRFFAT
jgi:hypothetical protein